MRKTRPLQVILIVLGMAWVLTATIYYWVHTSQTDADGRALARHEWPESVVGLLRDAEEKHIKIDHLNVYLGQHDNCFWRCDATRKLLDLMVARWELHPVKSSDKMVDLALQYMPDRSTGLSSKWRDRLLRLKQHSARWRMERTPILRLQR